MFLTCLFYQRIYTEEWLTEKTCEDCYAFNPAEPILKIPNDFNYSVPSFTEHSEYRKFIESFPEIEELASEGYEFLQS